MNDKYFNIFLPKNNFEGLNFIYFYFTICLMRFLIRFTWVIVGSLRIVGFWWVVLLSFWLLSLMGSAVWVVGKQVILFMERRVLIAFWMTEVGWDERNKVSKGLGKGGSGVVVNGVFSCVSHFLTVCCLCPLA